MRKRFWPKVYERIECDKPQKVIYKAPKGILTITVEVTRLYL